MSERQRYYIDKKILEVGLPFIEGLPDVGLVGTIVTSYLISTLSSSTAGYIDIEGMPPIMTIHNSKIYEPCRLHVCEAPPNKRLSLVYSDVPIPPPSIYSTALTIMEIASKIETPSFISVGGIAEPDRMEIEKPQVFVLSNDESVVEEALKTGTSHPFENGFITGMKAALLKEAMRRGGKVLVALAQSHMNYPDPGAAAQIIEFLNKYLGLEIDTDPLIQQAEQLKLQLRDLMRRTATQMAQLPKGLELESAPAYIR